MEEKRFYWLKLKEDFFDEKYIKALRRLPSGDSLVIVYLKMQLKSLKTEGIIKYQGILPDCISELALALDEDENIVNLTVEALIKFGVIERWEDDTFYMIALQQLIGSEGQSAARVRKHRQQKALQCNKSVTDCNVEIDIDKDKELDIEIEEKKYKRKEIEKKDNSIEEIFDFWNSKKIIVHRELIPELTAIIKNAINNYGKDNILSAIDRYSIVLKAEKFKLISYKWALKDFLKRKNALPDFLDDGSKWIAYNEWLAKENNYCNKVVIQDSGTKFGIDQSYLDSLG